MKLLQALTMIAAALLAGQLPSVLADTATNTPAPAAHGPHGPMIDRLLPPPLVTRLKLTADQQTTYDTLDTQYKADAAKWHAENPIDLDALKKARETGDKEALREFALKRQGLTDLHKEYIEKFKPSLTADQKSILDQALIATHTRRSSTGSTNQPAATPAPAPANAPGQ
jgi:hypothetical protein